MPKVTICVETDDSANQVRVKSWLLKWRDELGGAPENSGCGCCIDMYDVDVPWNAVRDLPETCFAYSDWAEWPSLDLPETNT
ncbi:MAG: hypothetical protein ABIY70_02900 [Capsulimonas sp.]|uniref:hypothetical protein n=1 Tax=Capsulimonas sp. TaxID=2494211 RepID=UPI0032665BAA